MSIQKRITTAVLAGVTFIVSFVALLFLAAWSEVMPPQIPRATVPLYVLIQLGIPSAAGLLVWRGLSRRWKIPPGVARAAWKTRAMSAVAAAYALTVVFGVPAVLSDQAAWGITEYKRVREHGPHRVFEHHPYIRAFAAIPVAPGVVVTYHEYQLDGLYGLGGFEVYVWYGIGTRSLACLPLWVS